MLATTRPDFVYRPRPIEDWQARLTTEAERVGDDFERFFRGTDYFPNFAEAFDIDFPLGKWHPNIMPVQWHKRFGNRGRFLVQNALHRYRLHYVTMQATRGKSSGSHVSLPLATLFAICQGVDPVRLEGKGARAALALWTMRLLYEARLLDDRLPARRYRRPLPYSLEVFGGLSVDERKVALLLLDAIRLQIDLCHLRSDTVLVYQAEHAGRIAPVVMASNHWLSWWCYGHLRFLCGSDAPMDRLAQKAADLRTRLRKAGLLWAEKGRDGYWRFGPAPLGEQDGSGVSLRELVDFFNKTK